MRPTKTLVFAVLIITCFYVFPTISLIAYIATALFAVVVCLDALTLLPRRNILAVREVSSSLALHQESVVSIYLQHELKDNLRIDVSDRCPFELNPEGIPTTVRVKPRSQLQLEYRIRPTVRGDFSFDFMDLAVGSRLGFWQCLLHKSLKDDVRVYPDFSQITRYLRILLAHHVHQIGIRKQIRRGEGLEFHQLREYRQGDALNHIDWKSTSKRRSLISREFQDERSQQILFLVDTGRRMHSDDGDVSLFDRTLDAILLLSYIALQQGDSISVLCFGQVQRWIPRMSGMTSVSSLLHQTYDLHTGTVASDYIQAAEDALIRQHKRALVILLTNLREDDSELPSALRLLTRRHIVMLANFRESVMDESLRHRADDLEGALSVLGAAKYIVDRQRVLDQCRTMCDIVIESTPQDFHTQIVNAYWQLKRSGRM